MPPVGNLPQLPLVARRPVRAYGMPPVENLPQQCLLPHAPGQRRKSNVPLWESTPRSAYDQTRRGQRRKHDIPVWESTPSSAYDQTRRGQRRKDDVPVSRLMGCGNLFPCRVQIAQWPRNDEMATRNRHVHVLGQVHIVRCGDRPGAV
jgi:hypothetical protein